MSEAWTDERTQLLKKYWSEGGSCAQIAARLGAPATRNSVIGKVHRLNLAGRPQKVKPARIPKAPREPKPPKPQKAIVPGHAVISLEKKKSAPLPPPRVVPIFDPGRLPCSIIDIAKEGCRYCVSADDEPQKLFCNQLRRDRVGPYCEAHSVGINLPTRARLFG